LKVLAFTPTYGDGPRPETLRGLAGQDWGLGEIVVQISWHNPFPAGDMRNVPAQYELAREMVLDYGFDALWTVEHDMDVPGDALRLLWEATSPPRPRSPAAAGEGGAPYLVAYGVYVLRHGVRVVNAWEYVRGSRNLGESLSLSRHRDRLRRAVRERQVVEVSGVGFGCTLIRREVLERIPFRAGEPGCEAPDVPFAVDCLRAGVGQVAHFGVLCGHWDDGEWLRVGETGGTVRVVARRDVTVSVEGESRRLRTGGEYELPEGEAAEMVRAGYVGRVVDWSDSRLGEAVGGEYGVGRFDTGAAAAGVRVRARLPGGDG
jgi:hypothetical protein